MREAIDFLAKSQRVDLASDLDRILRGIDFTELDLLRDGESEEITDEIFDAATITDLTEVLRHLARMMKVDHGTLHLVRTNSTSSFATRVMTTYSEEWVQLYVDRRYYFVDPVIQASQIAKEGFFWDTLPSSSTMLRQFWRDAEAHGVGPSGFTLPIVTNHGDTLALSISSTRRADSFRDVLSYYKSDLFHIGILLADSFSQHASVQRPASINCTDDQLLILQALSAGAEESDLEQKHFQFGSYKTLKRSICQLFHTRTVAQAAVIATKLGLLDSLPLSNGDVLTAENNLFPPSATLGAEISAQECGGCLRGERPDLAPGGPT